MTEKKEKKAPSSLRNFSNFMKTLLKNRRGAVGFGILVLFIGAAVAAPLITSYDPLKTQNLAHRFSAPLWFRFFTSDVVPNTYPIQDPGFDNATSLTAWPFQTGNATLLSQTYSQGSILFRYQRPEGLANGTASGTMEYIFGYPYSHAPPKFVLKPSILVEFPRSVKTTIELRMFIERTADQALFEIYNATVRRDVCVAKRPATWCIFEAQYPEDPAKGRLQAVGRPLTAGQPYVPNLDSDLIDMKARFIGLGYVVGNTAATFPSFTVFSQQGTYKFRLQMIVHDRAAGQAEQTSISYDNTQLWLVGDAWGVLGTDQFGRDIFTQLLYGARLSLFVGLLAAFLSVIIGLVAGLFAGYIGGIADEGLMRFTDMLLVLPGLPLLLVLIAVLGANIWNIIIIIGLLGWMGFARLVRSQVVSLKERPFIEAAKASGAGSIHILGRHVIPNVISLAYVTLALTVPAAIIAEAALSWLGLGDPTVSSWGNMLRDVQIFQGIKYFWWVVPPGLAIAAVSLSFILIGYSMDEMLNPRLRTRR